jgi:hypothetical protein
MLTELLDRARYDLAKARHLMTKRRQDDPPIVVFAMAKTGTTAVTTALRAAGLGAVFQVHDLDPVFLLREEREYRWTGRPWRNWDAQCLLKRQPATSAPWRVVSLVRDPIAQSVSAFFQPAARRGYIDSETAVEQLVERFGDRLDRLSLGWFESHLEPTLGIDVYDSPFDVARGYQIIETPNVKLLLMRCEGLAVAPHALADLLDADHPIDVPRKNVSAEKTYGDLYDDFVAALWPPSDVLDGVYSSRLVQHFYSPEEIARFREFWSIRDEPGRVPAPLER